MHDDSPGTAPPSASAVGEVPPGQRVVTQEDYERAQASPEFQELRRRVRAFAFPMTVAFLLWYLSYVLLSTYAEGLMSTPVIGNLNLGLLMGISQFLMTFLITWLYIRHANRNLDPIAEKLRDELEGEH